MKQTLRKSLEKSQNNFDQMRAIAYAYASNRKCSVQEAVYHCLPELWLRNFFSGVIYAVPISQRKGSKCFDQRKKSVTFRITLRVYSKKYAR